MNNMRYQTNLTKHICAAVNSITATLLENANFFLGLGKLLLPQQPVRPGLIAIKQARFQGEAYV